VIAFWIADSVFLVKTADGTWVSGGPYDPGWWTLSVMFAAAAWLPCGSVRRVKPGGLISVPIIFAAVALTVLVDGALTRINLLAVGFSIGSLVAVLVRLVMTFRAHSRMLQRSQALALSDPLTGLANRRALAQELAERLEANGGAPLILASFDLNGFKAYNDAFGHLAGDALLQRLAGSLQSAVSGTGTAYRMGGDEFSLLLPDSAAGVSALRAAAAALIEHGEGFSIDASVGSVRVPAEAADPELAMKLADERMYLHKRSGRRISEAQQISRALLAALAHRDPQLGEHVHDVGRLAAATAAALGCAPAVVEAVHVAAELHDVGKVAIPEAILSKPSELTEQEWALMRQHTVAGERILASTTALHDIAPLVRSSHERWDGSGYPDGLAGEQIPLGARIIAVCDAFHAMTSERPYRGAMSRDVALAELQAHAGRQFDPRVVAEFVHAFRHGALNAPFDVPLSEPAVDRDPEAQPLVDTVPGPGALPEPQAAG
jgi:diguanylate cyclase (GGDEF)-like protein